MSDWQPGDVAMVECSDGQQRRAFMIPSLFGENSGSWMFENSSRRRVDESAAHPLVVIDAEDREQVERLADLFTERHHSSQQSNTASEHGVRSMQAALREFATPKPPRPEEPTGLGAVVEDEDGLRWVQVRNDDRRAYRLADGEHRGRYLQYANITAVTVLSEGVER